MLQTCLIEVGKTHTYLHVRLPNALHGHLKELAEPYGGWEAWLKNIQRDFAKARKEIEFYKGQAEFYQRELAEARRRLEAETNIEVIGRILDQNKEGSNGADLDSRAREWKPPKTVMRTIGKKKEDPKQ